MDPASPRPSEQLAAFFAIAVAGGGLIATIVSIGVGAVLGARVIALAARAPAPAEVSQT